MFLVTTFVLSLIVEFAIPDTGLFGGLFEGLFGEGVVGKTGIASAGGIPTAGGWGRMIAISLAVTLVELFTPRGFDNLSVPLCTAGLFTVIPF